MRRWIGLALLVVGAVVVGPMTASGSGGGTDDGRRPALPEKSSTYVVFMRSSAAIAYEGDVAGLPATAPDEGEKLDRTSTAVARYVRRLRSEQDAALRAAGADPAAKLASYAYATNGFAASLTPAQAAALRAQPSVSMVMRDRILHVQTDASPDFLGLTAPNGPWATGLTGENVVVGVLDTGIWPEHPSFADDGTYPPLSPAEFSGTGCDFGNVAFNPNDQPFECNGKLLAAKSYGEVFHEGTGAGLADGSYLSARDEDGHGTHTASTAAGNSGVQATLLGVDRGTVSGMAPRARISVYKVCWSGAEGDGCSSGDIVAAIDDAVADGVDVINFSVGSDTATLSPDAIGFLFANDAGVLVAASAGNAGPGAGTVGSPAVAPWVTAVGASTQVRDFRGTVTFGDGQVFEGVTVTGGIGDTPLVDATALGNPLCLADPGFPEGSVAGAMVLCERGGNARVEKSKVVADAGGAALLLYNPTLNTLNTDNHYIPSLHVDDVAGAAARAYIESAGESATASLSGGEAVEAQPDVTAAFSSRGPNLLSPDLITPDVVAPGVNILAGNTPTALLGAPGQLFQAISGTSMSSPHVAGIYALLRQAHPDWSPAAAKSALMTTALPVLTKEDGVSFADPFDMGAGLVSPGGNLRTKGSLYNPGLVYDAVFDDYAGYLCEAAPDLVDAAYCDDLAAFGIPTTAENLNVASIGISDVTGPTTIVRTVTNVSKQRIVWRSDLTVPEGYEGVVTPSRLRLAPGESASFEVTFTPTTAEFGSFSFGQLVWWGGGYVVQSPIALQSKELAAPTQAVGTGVSGSVDLPVTFGYTGPYSARAQGLVPATTTAGSVVDDPANDIIEALTSGVGVTLHEIEVPADTGFARFSLFDAEVDGPHDLDLYLIDPAGDIVAVSGSGTSEEQIDLVDPPPGTYTVVVHAFEAAGGVANYTLFDWLVPVDDGEGTLTITSAPTEATIGGSGVVTAAWAGLEAGGRYLGTVAHIAPSGQAALTVVEVTT